MGPGCWMTSVAGIEKHIATSTEGYWRRLDPRPAGIGCVPWLTDDRVVGALVELDVWLRDDGAWWARVRDDRGIYRWHLAPVLRPASTHPEP